jgi:integrase
VAGERSNTAQNKVLLLSNLKTNGLFFRGSGSSGAWANPNESEIGFHLTYERFKELMQAITSPIDVSLFATIYCAYARVGEIVRGRYIENPPVGRSQLEFTPQHLKIRVLTEKTHQYRTVPTSRKIEGWLHWYIENWLDVCGEYLFPYTTAWAQKRFKKWFGTWNIHLLRHWATTHALQGKRTIEPLSAQEVARLGGWTTLDCFYKTYTHFTPEDFLHKI